MLQNKIDIDDKYCIRINDKFINNFSIFNNTKFIELHANKYDQIISFELIHISKDSCEGIFNLGIKKTKEVNSPPAGSYGSFEFTENISFQLKEIFIKKILAYIETFAKKTIEITLCPDIYNLENNSQVQSILFRNKFFIDRIETNQYIDLKKYSYEKSISYGNRKRIKKCIKQGFYFSKLNDSQYLEAYNVIKTNRKRRNFPITMTWEGICEMINLFPEKIKFFGLMDDKIIIASAICINVINEIIYVFYWGDIDSYEKFSPIAYLSNQLFEHFKAEGFNLVDIGTSSENSIPNSGLVKFKENIGCNSCNKIYLKKILI